MGQCRGKQVVTICAHDMIHSRTIFYTVQAMTTVIGQMTCVVVFLGAPHLLMTPLYLVVMKVLLWHFSRLTASGELVHVIMVSTDLLGWWLESIHWNDQINVVIINNHTLLQRQATKLYFSFLEYLGVSGIPDACTAAVSGPGTPSPVKPAEPSNLAKSALFICKSAEVKKEKSITVCFSFKHLQIWFKLSLGTNGNMECAS